MAVGYGVSGVWLILCGLIVFLVHKLTDGEDKANMTGRMPALVAESLFVVILFAVGIILRMKGLSGAGEEAAYFELTQVAEGQTIPAVVHGAVYLYLQLLHLVYWIFGNHFIAGIWLQIALQMVAGFFLYRAVRRISGVIPSLVLLGVVMAVPLAVTESLTLSPKMLFLAIFALILYICAGCISGRKNPGACLFTGLCIAVVCYLDIMGIALLLVAIVGILLKRGEDDRSFGGRFVGSLLCMLGCAIGFALLIFADAYASGKDWMSVLNAWWELYSPSAFAIPRELNLSNLSVEFLFLLLVLALGIFSYWCRFETENQSIWILLAIALILLKCFGMTTSELDGYLNLYIVLATLAGAGIGGMFGFSGEDEDELRPLAKIDMEEDVPVVKEKPASKEVPLPVKEPEQETKPELQPQKVKFIENPLPLPKKHVKKVLDYDLELVEGQDDFDLNVDENDDYDI